MDFYEKRFLNEFQSQFKQLPNGTWVYMKDPTFICTSSAPAKEFKTKYPKEYQKLLDAWFDEVHPY